MAAPAATRSDTSSGCPRSAARCRADLAHKTPPASAKCSPRASHHAPFHHRNICRNATPCPADKSYTNSLSPPDVVHGSPLHRQHCSPGGNRVPPRFPCALDRLDRRLDRLDRFPCGAGDAHQALEKKERKSACQNSTSSCKNLCAHTIPLSAQIAEWCVHKELCKTSSGPPSPHTPAIVTFRGCGTRRQRNTPHPPRPPPAHPLNPSPHPTPTHTPTPLRTHTRAPAVVVGGGGRYAGVEQVLGSVRLPSAPACGCALGGCGSWSGCGFAVSEFCPHAWLAPT